MEEKRKNEDSEKAQGMEEHIKEKFIKKYNLGGIVIWLLCLHDLSGEEIEHMVSRCDKARRERIERIKPELRKRQSAGAGYLLFLLKKRFGIEEDAVILPGGKPVFLDNRDVCFSISHSGNYAALAFGETPLGMDMECVRQANLKVAKRFFRAEEYAYLAGKGGIEQADKFCEIWTAKEALVKASGDGLSMPLEHFSVLGNTVECAGEIYKLYRRKLEICEESVWISVAVCDAAHEQHKHPSPV